MTWYADYRDDYLATGSGRPRLIGRHRTVRRLTLRPNDVHQVGDFYPLVSQPSRASVVAAVLDRATINSYARFQMVGVRRRLARRRTATAERLRAAYINMGSTARSEQQRKRDIAESKARQARIQELVSEELCPTHGEPFLADYTMNVKTHGRGEAQVYCGECRHWWHLTDILPKQEAA